jgi:hypothetical protein
MRRARPFAAVRGPSAIAAASALGVALTGACGGDDDQKSPVEIYASQYGNAICAEMESCGRANGLTFNRNECGLWAAIYVQGQVDRELAAGATFDPAAADKCIAAATEATRACTPNEDFAATRRECPLVWSGPKKIGDKCKDDIECESSTAGAGVCIGKSPDIEGTCGIRTSGGVLNEVCGKTANATAPETVVDCGPDNQCNLLSQTCSPRVPLGGINCNDFNPCEKGLFCDSSGACVAGLDAGADCDENVPKQCTSGACIRGKCAANPVGTLIPCTGAMQ